MNIKPYDLGLYIARVQHIHIGHCSVIDTALKLCDRVLILIGSSQESATKLNPFDYETRATLIKEIYGDRVIIKPLNDLNDKEDVSTEWTKYLLKEVKRHSGKLPDITIFGDESSNGWFTDDEMRDCMRIIVPRNRLNICATQMREWLLLNDKERWFEYANPKTHKHYDKLRGELLSVPFYKEVFDRIVKANIKLKGWTDYGVGSSNVLESPFEGQEEMWD